MAFVLEDGSAKPDANALISVQFFRDYHADRGVDFSAETDSDIETWIIKATDYSEKRFGRKYKGYRRSKDQGLEWPRLSAFDDDGFLLSGGDDVPRQLEKAIAEYARIVKEVIDLLPRPANRFATVDSAGNVDGGVGGQVIETVDKIGPIEERRKYASSADNPDFSVDSKSGLVTDLHIPEYPAADLWVEELLQSGGPVLGRGD